MSKRSADLRTDEINPDSEQNEPAKPQGLKVSFCERGANPREIAPIAK